MARSLLPARGDYGKIPTLAGPVSRDQVNLMLISFARQQGLGIDFLIHDSTIFDGVDPRQRAHAIELAAEKAAEHGFQYILTLNTDMFPIEDFSPNFDAESLVRLRLTDTNPSGSLLGFRL